ncbi:hypothetical protein HAZT_HAZT003258 [Hyalella azteca]|uniref:Uncharacterized protein n=1 Tax=Hyalella azteca TaxID=294128 RepID=A0A6A0GUJ2_HYAAZ|nr:hypothetical protein HAZT_HAZT003258 [Hyalella azteca]
MPATLKPVPPSPWPVRHAPPKADEPSPPGPPKEEEIRPALPRADEPRPAPPRADEPRPAPPRADEPRPAPPRADEPSPAPTKPEGRRIGGQTVADTGTSACEAALRCGDAGLTAAVAAVAAAALRLRNNVQWQRWSRCNKAANYGGNEHQSLPLMNKLRGVITSR